MQLSFGAVTEADVEKLAAWIPSQHWPFHDRAQVNEAWVRERAQAGYFWGPDTRSFWAFESADAPLGLIRVFELDDGGTPLIDLRVADDARGRGVGSATLAWATTQVFETLPNVGRLGGYTRHDNLAMRRVFEKCRYLQEAYHRRAWRVGDVPLADAVGYAVLREEHESVRVPTASQVELHAGSCLCRSVRYEVRGEFGDFGYCHCRSCQKASGSAHAANVPVARADFSILSGSETLREFESSPGKYRVFCSTCGSPIYAYLATTPDVLRVRLGTLDTPFTKLPKAHTFVSERAPWAPIVDGVPQFPEWAPRDVLNQAGSKQP